MSFTLTNNNITRRCLIEEIVDHDLVNLFFPILPSLLSTPSYLSSPVSKFLQMAINIYRNNSTNNFLAKRLI